MLNHKSKIQNLKYCILLVTCALYIGVYGNAFALNLDSIKVAILKGDYKQAITEGEKAIATPEQGRLIDEAYYLLAISYLKDTNYLRASDIFEIIIKEFPDSKFKEEARLGLGDTYLLRGNFDKAQVNYEELLKANPNTKLRAQAYHRLSQIGFKKGDTNQGKMYLEMLRQEFPENTELILNRDLYPVAMVMPATKETVRPAIEVYYTVQVGAFSKKPNADNLVKKLTQEGYPAYVEAVMGMEKESYRVRVGKFSSRQEALILEEKLSQKGYPTKIYP